MVDIFNDQLVCILSHTFSNPYAFVFTKWTICGIWIDLQEACKKENLESGFMRNLNFSNHRQANLILVGGSNKFTLFFCFLL